MQKENMLVDSRQAYVQVIDYIRQEILLGNLAVGMRLPAERNLSETLNISRNSVREALRIMEIMGTVVSVRGSGHYISNNFEGMLIESLSMMFMLNELTFKQISQLRYALEMRSFALAIQNITEEDLQELQSIILLLDDGPSEEENVILDKKLHYTIARASGNQLFVQILQALSDVMDRFIADLRQDIMQDDKRKAKLFESHRRIVDCIQRKDIIGGYSAIDEHFDLIERRLEERAAIR